MPSVTVVENPSTEGVNLVDLGRRLWARKGAGVIFALLCITAAVLYLQNARYVYTATMVVTPADQSGARAPQGLSGLGSLVGLDIGGQANSSFALYGDALTAMPVVEKLSRDRRVMRNAFKDAWDPVRKQWREPKSTARSIVYSFKGLLGLPRNEWHPPDVRDLKMFIENNVTVEEDKRKAGFTVTMEQVDPEFARFFLDRLHGEADMFLRERALSRATSYVRYLERRLGEVQVAEYRQTLAQTLAGYERTRMMASADASYAADVFGVTSTSPVPTSPRLSIVMAIAIATSLFLWLFYVFIFVPTAQRARAGR